jgi:hypothetical protein
LPCFILFWGLGERSNNCDDGSVPKWCICSSANDGCEATPRSVGLSICLVAKKLLQRQGDFPFLVLPRRKESQCCCCSSYCSSLHSFLFLKVNVVLYSCSYFRVWMFESKLQCCCCWWWWWWWWWFFLGVLSLFVCNCLHCILILLGCWLVSRVAVSCLESILSLCLYLAFAFWSCLVVDESFLLLVLARSPYSLSVYNLPCILISVGSCWVFLGIWNLDYLVCRFAVLAGGSFEGSWGCIVSGSKFWVHHLAVVCCWETFQRSSKVLREKVFWGSGTLCDFRLRCPDAVQFVCSLGVRITSLLRNVVRILQLCVQRDVCFWSRPISTEATELSRCYASRWCHLISHLISSFKGIQTYEEFPLLNIESWFSIACHLICSFKGFIIYEEFPTLFNIGSWFSTLYYDDKDRESSKNLKAKLNVINSQEHFGLHLWLIHCAVDAVWFSSFLSCWLSLYRGSRNCTLDSQVSWAADWACTRVKKLSVHHWLCQYFQIDQRHNGK